MDTTQSIAVGKNNTGMEYRTKKFKNAHRQDFKSKNDKFNVKDRQASKTFFVKKSSDFDNVIKDAPAPSTSKTVDTVKKPFDKRKWRMQRYSKKYKLQQWEENRKKAVLREYYKQIKDDVPPKVDAQKIYEDDEKNLTNTVKPDEIDNENNLNQEVTDVKPAPTTNSNYGNNRRPYIKAQKEYDRLKEEKNKKREEYLKRKEEKDKALKDYKQRKVQTYRKLNKKTKKGQPVMKHRMQMLLEQIQKSTEQ